MRHLCLLFCLIFAVPVVAQTATSLASLPGGRVVDLLHPCDEASVYWPTAEPFKLETDFEGVTDKGYFYSAYRYSAAEHGGTHIDAPVHFAKGHHPVDEIPLDQLMGNGIVIDVTAQCAANRDYLVSVTDFENWERRNGRIAPGTIVFLRTGFAKYYPDRKMYLGTDERGAEAVGKVRFFLLVDCVCRGRQP